MGKLDNFKRYALETKDQYGGWINFINTISTDIFNMTRQANSSDMIKILPDKILPGNFYLIQYNYNGNPIWCPILTLERKVIRNKNIVFALNIEYLPLVWRIEFFNKIFLVYKDVLGKNEDQNIKQQRRIPIKFESIYKLLKDGHKEYVITAFDVSKIKNLHLVSSNLSPHFVFLSTLKYNSRNMKELYTISRPEEKLKIGQILEEYNKILEEYQLDSEEFHRKLKSFENQFKLFEN